MVEGEVEFHIGDRGCSATAGDFVSIPKGTVHWFRNTGNRKAKLLVTYVPAGFEKFFEETLDPAHDRSGPPPTPPEVFVQRYLAAAAKYGLEMPQAPNLRKESA